MTNLPYQTPSTAAEEQSVGTPLTRAQLIRELGIYLVNLQGYYDYDHQQLRFVARIIRDSIANILKREGETTDAESNQSREEEA